MDDIDTRLLSALSANARTPVTDLAKLLNLARTTVQARLERLERRGVIAGYTVKLGAALQESRIRATVLVQLNPRFSASVVARLKSIPQVEIAHTSSGRFDMVLQLTAQTTTKLDQILGEVGAFEGVLFSESLIHLSTKFDRAT